MNSTFTHAAAATLLAGSLMASAAGSVLAAPAMSTVRQRPMQFVAQVEGVTTVQTLRADLKQGETLLQIAGAKYATAGAGALAAALLAPVQTRLAAAVTARTITTVQESTRYAKLDARVTALVTKAHPAGALLAVLRPRFRILLRTEVKDVATTCHTTPKALRMLLRTDGGSVLTACQTTYSPATAAQPDSQVTAAQLTDVVFAPIKNRLQAAERAGHLTATQEAGRSTHIQAVITRAITHMFRAHPVQ